MDQQALPAEHGTAARQPPRQYEWSLMVLAWCALGILLYVGKAAFAPILFAVLLALLLSPLVDRPIIRYQSKRQLANNETPFPL